MSLVCHLLFEQTVLPAPTAWLPIALLGLGPVGLAFFAWDYGVKHGNIKVLGALSYIAPLLSSVLLIVFGQGAFHVRILLACLCIIAGSVVASQRGGRAIQPRPGNASPDAAEHTGAR
jgi:drug/metabolite transporter (DMT)-like permease